ncbi:TIGR03905 family TSCPD domain-containing protein [Desulfovibrio gilichinskyi]|uniref:ribonucleoside-diphosphate reductase n=1 Tax=Desulfovibrio gilichinskyi TaxID=1519643 RepID=A0A1X7EJX9_9BACT|nr:TIGR03905 family TSCPD domain-containing protein [Desulfovibrio gilichinskyi]SMF35228.1 uncharacterized protein TIGR03905 [Desulfovibrio gilichinskyi]
MENIENINRGSKIIILKSENTYSADVETFIPQGVCSTMINFAVEDGKLVYVDFTGGCPGNLKAISALITDMPVQEIVGKLKGITCGNKSTSCADQLCKALDGYMK